MTDRDVLCRIAASLEDIVVDKMTKKRAREEDAAPRVTKTTKRFYELWWRESLMTGKLYVNRRETHESISEVLNRLQGKVVAHSQAFYNGLHTQSWTVEVDE